MSSPLVELKSVCLEVPHLQAKASSILTNPLKMLSNLYLRRDERKTIRLLENISFTINASDRIGVLGRNGAGKSTLLRLVGKVYEPSSGTVYYNTDPVGFFTTGSGMLPEATGLENIYLRGLELGYKLSEIKNKVEEIVEFAGLEEHLNKPIYMYSTGMNLRLAVAITFTVEPELLLLDEWIGAGDADFKKKITSRLNEIIDKSKGFMVASHNHSLLRQTCNRGIVISKGEISFIGSIDDAINYFRNKQGSI